MIIVRCVGDVSRTIYYHNAQRQGYYKCNESQLRTDQCYITDEEYAMINNSVNKQWCCRFISKIKGIPCIVSLLTAYPVDSNEFRFNSDFNNFNNKCNGVRAYPSTHGQGITIIYM